MMYDTHFVCDCASCFMCDRMQSNKLPEPDVNRKEEDMPEECIPVHSVSLKATLYLALSLSISDGADHDTYFLSLPGHVADVLDSMVT